MRIESSVRGRISYLMHPGLEKSANTNLSKGKEVGKAEELSKDGVSPGSTL